MFRVDRKASRGCLTHGVLVHIQIQNDVAFGRDLRRHLKLQIGLAKGNRRGTTRSGDLVGQFRALLYQRLDLVGGDHAWAGNHLALAIRFQCGEFQIQETIRRRVENRHSKSRRGISPLADCRQVDEIAGCHVRRAFCRRCAKNRVHASAAGAEDFEAPGRAQAAAEFDAQRFSERIGGFHNARFNQHLPHWHVDLGNQLLHLFELARNVSHEQLVGPGFKDDASASAQDSAGSGSCTTTRTGGHQAACDLGGFAVVDLERLGAQWLQVLQSNYRFQLQFFLGGDLVARCDPQHVARLAHTQALGLKNDVERLVPWDVLQAQGHSTVDRIRGDDVEVGEIGNHLQQRAHFDVLEIERELLAAVSRALRQFRRIHLERLDLQHELLITLVSTMHPGAARLNHHAHAVAGLEGRDGLHRRAEVGHVEAPAQAFRQARFQELDHHILALHPYVHADLVIGQCHHNAAGTVYTTAKIKILDGKTVAVAVFREHGT